MRDFLDLEKKGKSIMRTEARHFSIQVTLMIALLGIVAGDAAAQAWDQKIDKPQRFEVLKDFDNEAVLDKETQLVWQRTPGGTVRFWGSAISSCFGTRTGGRGGWRLPTMPELTSLIDPTQDHPPLPVGHPFDLSNLTGDVWSTNTVPGSDTANTQDVLNDGFLGGTSKTAAQQQSWCVRGGPGVEGQ
jgi:hypothetical protein